MSTHRESRVAETFTGPTFKRSSFLNPNIVLPLLAFIVRILYLLGRQSSPFFTAPEIDQAMHDQWAQQIAQGDFWGQEAFFRAPLYYYFLALIYYLFGHNYIIPRIIQFLLGALSTWLTYRLGRRLYGEEVGILAGVLYALCGPIIYFEGELLIPALLLPLILLALNQLDRQRINPSSAGFFVAGLGLGLAALARPNILLFIPCAWAWIAWVIKGKFRWLMTLTGGVLLVILPITVRNYVLSKDFVLISSQAGVNFYIGNNPYSNGYTAQVPGFPADWDGVEGSTRFAQEDSGRKLKPSEVGRYWFQRAVMVMSKRPLQWANLTLHKVRLLLSGCEISNNEDLYFQRRYSIVLAILMWDKILAFPFGLLVPLGFLGLVLNFSWRRDSHLILYFAAYSLSIVAFFVCTRYRLPLIPILAIWSGAALVEIYQLVKNKAVRPWIVPIIGAVLLFIVVNRNPLAGEGIPRFKGIYYLGNKYLSLQNYPRAEAAFREALALDPNSALARHGLGMSLLHQDQPGAARTEFQRAIQSDSSFIPARNNLARLLEKQGDLRAALEQFRVVLQLDSSDALAQRGLADVALKLGDYDLAERHYQVAYSLGAQDRQLISRWAQALVQQGKYTEALEVNVRLLALEPDNARAHHNQARIYLSCDSLERAREELETVLRLDPDNTEAREQMEEIAKLK